MIDFSRKAAVPRQRKLSAAEIATKSPKATLAAPKGRPIVATVTGKPAATKSSASKPRIDFDDLIVDEFEHDVESLPIDEVEGELDLEVEATGEGGESHVDDPVRMYLMQMGEIPMLNRADEISSARSIEAARTRFRRTLLCNDLLLQGAVELLEKVASGELRLDRTIEVSVTNTAEKKRMLKRLVPNLVTIRHLLAQNKTDFYSAVSKTSTPAQKRSRVAPTDHSPQ